MDRLTEVLASVNKEMEGLEKHKATLHFVDDVWSGYNQKLGISFRNAAHLAGGGSGASTAKGAPSSKRP